MAENIARSSRQESRAKPLFEGTADRDTLEILSILSCPTESAAGYEKGGGTPMPPPHFGLKPNPLVLLVPKSQHPRLEKAMVFRVA
jgi:hypothetical protein